MVYSQGIDGLIVLTTLGVESAVNIIYPTNVSLVVQRGFFGSRRGYIDSVEPSYRWVGHLLVTIGQDGMLSKLAFREPHFRRVEHTHLKPLALL